MRWCPSLNCRFVVLRSEFAVLLQTPLSYIDRCKCIAFIVTVGVNYWSHCELQAIVVREMGSYAEVVEMSNVDPRFG
jgi:hypothetical protein